MNEQTPKISGPQPWPPEALKFVQDYQEREYRRLAVALGLGSDPKAAYARLTRPPIPFDQISPQKLKQDLGVESQFPPEEWLHFDNKVADLHARYFSAGPPTPYEDPNFYPVMAMIFDEMQEALTIRGQPFTSRPLLATLPLGDVNALVLAEPKTHVPILFFDRGLFQFFNDFARLVGWAVPALSPEQLSNDLALARLARRYTMPLQASGFLLASLSSYVVEGTPMTNPSPIPLPRHNLFTSMILLKQMERFVMAHELAHISLGHFDKPPAKEQEYEADALSLDLITTLTNEDLGSWAVGYWACELVFVSLQFLYTSIGLFAFGNRNVEWISETHPMPIERAEILREIWLKPSVPKMGVAAARELCGMTEGLLQQLWEIILPLLEFSYQKGDRPSMLWENALSDIQPQKE